jgi:hypothetical protein
MYSLLKYTLLLVIALCTKSFMRHSEMTNMGFKDYIMMKKATIFVAPFLNRFWQDLLDKKIRHSS